MKTFTEQELEGMLRDAPKPRAPRGLKERLMAQTRSTGAASSRTGRAVPRAGWLRRWWPVLVPAGLSLVCAIVMAVQQGELRELKQAVQTLSANPPPPVAAVAAAPKTSEVISTDNTAASQQTEEITRLTGQIAKLSGEISELERMRAENQSLRAQLAAPISGMFSEEELSDMRNAKERAMRIRCVNNLKQMGLAARVWANDDNQAFPPDIVSMSNELSTTIILVCPSDTNRKAAADFQSYSDANCSYQFLASHGSFEDNEPNRVMFLCPIHGNVCLCDGSVQMGVGKDHPDWLVQRDGKTFFEPPAQ